MVESLQVVMNMTRCQRTGGKPGTCFAFAAAVCALCGGFIMSAAGAPAEVQEGDTVSQVIERLGGPQGQIVQGRNMTFYYDRGMIDFVDGRVVKANLLTVAEAGRAREARVRAEAERRRRAEQEQKRLAADGETELRKSLADPSFAQRPASERLVYWQDFSVRYPFTDVANLTAAAAAAVDAGRRQQERTDEVAALKRRIGQIQDRLKQLDADYAASLMNWKRNEIDAERTKLTQELDVALPRVRALEGQTGTNAPPAVPSVETPAVK